jgi:hypothetical protein
LPNEIQAQIFNLLDVRDILSLRLTSHALAQILSATASAISRPILARRMGGDSALYLKTLYPQPRPCTDLDYFLQMLHRNAVVDKMVLVITDFIQYKIYQVKSSSRQRQFAPCRKRLLSRLKAPTFIIYHFLETLRAKISTLERIDLWPESASYEICSSCSHLQCAIIDTYPADALLPTYQFFKIMVSAFRQKLRPPTYAGTLERRLRGWHRSPATDADVTKVLLFGGLKEVQRIMRFPRYILRLAEVRAFVDRLDGIIPPSQSRDPLDPSTYTTSSRLLALQAAMDAAASFDESPMPPLPAIWSPAARSKILKAAIVAGLVTTEWQIPDAFTFIQDIIADRETQLGESSGFNPNISFEQRVQAAEADGPEDEIDEGLATDAGPSRRGS